MTGERDFLVGKRVTVVGLGIEGVDCARYAATHGARVTVTDAKPPKALAARLQQLEGLPIRYVLGEHQNEDVAVSDLLFVSQSVPLSNPLVAEARERGVPLSSMTAYFLEHCPGPTIGITGSSGKTTVTSLVAAMLEADGRFHRVGGNIGTGLLGLLDGIDASTWTVMEVSHTQLTLTRRSPHIAAILNITQNHLDQFRWADYVELKRNIARYQTAEDIVVLNADDAGSYESAGATDAATWWYSMEHELAGEGAFLDGERFILHRGGPDERVMTMDEVPLPGRHNIENALAATAIAGAAGITTRAISSAIRTFRGLPHRLEDVGRAAGVRYVNDSVATTPERALAGIRSFEEPLVLLLGGKDKDLPKDELAQEALRRCAGIVFFGTDGALFEAAVEANAATVAYEDRPQTARVTTLTQAVAAARAVASPGDVVLLSPACTSFDAYANFEERGDEFRRLVLSIAEEGA